MSTARLLWVERRAATTSEVAPARPLVPFACLGAAITALAVLTSAALTGIAWGPVAATALVAFIGFATAIALMPRHYPHARLGGANIVTSVRLGLVAVLAGMLLAVEPASIAIIVIAIVALSLDGVDGMLARRQGLSSRFGASFDMEVDSVFALVLAALAALGPAGPLALLLGLPRYLFGGATVVAPWLNGPLDERFSRKVVCVVQLIALIALQLPILPAALAVTLTVGVALMLAWSFGLDIVALRRARAA